MEKLDPRSDGFSMDMIEENVEKLKALFPEIVTDGKVDFEVLREVLGNGIDDGEERYRLTWSGKKRARRLALSPSNGTLRPKPDESVNWDTTKNLFIEGDNLEVLKLLQKSYYGKVKMIYIDPPYNTGKDFVYPDDYFDNIQNYLELTGQFDENGRKFSSNSETSGRYHTDWLTMIYPRLRLARNLLSEEGILFVSIDDNEQYNLRLLLNDIFGEENFQGMIVVQSNKRGQTYKDIAKTHEYLMVYTKDDQTELFELEKAGAKLPYNDAIGQFDLWELRNRNPKFGRHNRPNLYFPIYVAPNITDASGYNKISIKQSSEYSEKAYPLNSEGKEGCWRWSREKLVGVDLDSDHPEVVAKKVRGGSWNIYQKSRKSTTKPKSLWLESAVISEQGTIELGKLDMASAFDHPKPLALMEKAIRIATSPDDIILDFFAGSGTTGHAVMKQNATDGGMRRFVLVQLPEPLDSENKDQSAAAEFCDKLNKPRNIAELTKERLRRAAMKVRDDNPLFAGDLGFRVLTLDTTNISDWEFKPDDIEVALELSIEHLKTDRTYEDILYELLLKYGLDLVTPIEQRKVGTKTFHVIGEGALVVCLEDDVTVETVEGIAALKDELNPEVEMRVVFKDAGFKDDVVKTNAVQILRQAGITDVKSL